VCSTAEFSTSAVQWGYLHFSVGAVSHCLPWHFEERDPSSCTCTQVPVNTSLSTNIVCQISYENFPQKNSYESLILPE
jgi:hypothetical protein